MSRYIKSVTYNEDYILDKVTITPGGCWNWNKATDINGYGQVSRISSGESLAHRLSYRIFKGSCVGLHVLHSCDNPPCCNPEHLRTGTQADNIRDALTKSRMVFNKKGHVPIIPREDIPGIYEEYNRGGITQQELANRYRVTQAAISNIIIKYRNLHHG